MGWAYDLKKYYDVYHMLEDEQSKFVYLIRLNYMITRDYRFIEKISPSWLPRTDKNGQHAFIEEILSEIPADVKIILYGAGEYAEETYFAWNADPRIVAFCSNNKRKQQNGYLGRPVISPEILANQRDFFVIVTAIKPQPKMEILKQLNVAGYPVDKVFYLSFPDALDENQYFVTDIIKFEEEEIFVDAGSYDLDVSLKLRKKCAGLKKSICI